MALVAIALGRGCGSEEDAAPVEAGPDGAAASGPDGAAVADGQALESDASMDAAGQPTADAGSDAGLDAGPCPDGPPVIPALKITPLTSATFSAGVFAAQPPGSDDWYIVEQEGRVKILRNGNVLATPFLDIHTAIGTPTGLRERGLLSIAFHPSYATNGRFFLMGTPGDGADGTLSASNADAIVEFKRSAANPDVAETTKVRDIVVLPASAPNHNGGTIAFGPDGMLYAGTGDGGGACESAEPGAVQDTKQLFGKILRLDVDKAAPFAAAGNPFADDPRVYHYGLRNPYRWSFDSLTGDLFIGDVGQSTFEEISLAVGNAPGKNFGWPAYEGEASGTCAGKTLGGPSPYTPPILGMDRRAGSTSPFKDYTSVIGGRVYRGSAIPSLYGVYMFADFTGASFGFLHYCHGEMHGPVAVKESQVPAPTAGPALITAFAEGHDHEIYLLYGYSAAQLGKFVPQ
jgi:glucose/arabinose dehydrogenase